MYAVLNSPKYSEMKQKLTYIVQTAPDRFYLALFLKPYAEEMPDTSLHMLYTCLNRLDSSPRSYLSAIQTTIENCHENTRVHEVIQEMIQKFYY